MPNEEIPLPVSTSQTPDFLPAALSCYQGAVECLAEAAIPFAIAGAFALHRHTGIWRSTKDLDIFLEPRVAPEALHRLRERGFRTDIPDPVWLAKAWCGEYFVDLITALGNAALLVDSTWIDRSEPYRFFGIPCRVLGAEEIIATKLFVSRRERFDLADVAHLIRTLGQRLDWQRLLQLMTGHEELLLWSLVFFAYVYPARVDLVPRALWSTLLHGLQHHIEHPQPGAPFRGTLIDPNMFAIDVNEWGERDLYRENCENHPCLLEEDPQSNSESGSEK
ncbi:MAG TPA: hypothetical protein VGR47_03525 [Terracidiphilus sp.]|nr:hypothetical protein [Terracidiphilus sp.]